MAFLSSLQLPPSIVLPFRFPSLVPSYRNGTSDPDGIDREVARFVHERRPRSERPIAVGGAVRKCGSLAHRSGGDGVRVGVAFPRGVGPTFNCCSF